jgi:hypothetical protein
MAQTGRVLSFLRPRPSSSDWTQEELAEFYRVESALLQGGLVVTTDRGLTDEGDPWFVFCIPESEEVIAHFARMDGHYLVASSAFSGIARGRDFKLLVRELMQSHPLMLPRHNGRDEKIFLHPVALLAALVAASYAVSSDKDAAIQSVSASGHEKGFGWFQLSHDFAIVSAVALAAAWIENHVESAFNLIQDMALLPDAGANSSLGMGVTPEAGYLDSAAQGLFDDSTATHKIASDPIQPVVFETRNDTSDVITPAPSALPKAPMQSIGASVNFDGVTVSHADGNDSLQTSTQVLGNPDFSGDFGYLWASKATGLPPATGSLPPTVAIVVEPDNSISLNQQNSNPTGVVSTDQLPSKDAVALVSSPLAPSGPAASTLAPDSATTIAASTPASPPQPSSAELQPITVVNQSALFTVLEHLEQMHAAPQQITLVLASLGVVPAISMPLIPTTPALNSSDMPQTSPTAPMQVAAMPVAPAAAASLTGVMEPAPLTAPTHTADMAPPHTIIGIISDAAHHPVI